MSSPYWNPQEPRPLPHAPQGGWGPAPPPGSGWGRPDGGVGPFPGRPPAPATVGFGRRLAARCVDYVLVVIAAFAFFVSMALVTVLLTGSDRTTEAQGNLWALLFFFGWGVLLFFYDWFYLVVWGRTLGKMMFGIKVVSADDGGGLTQGQAMGRAAFFGLPQCLPIAGNLWALAESMGALGDSRSRALHDRAAGTLVVRT